MQYFSVVFLLLCHSLGNRQKVVKLCVMVSIKHNDVTQLHIMF